MDLNINHLEFFLQELNIIRKKYEEKELQKEQFNVFTILRDESDEVKLHSRFISSLLSYKKKNEYRYLNAFLQEIDSVFEYDNFSLEVYPSYDSKNEYKDIDILLIDRTTRFAIIIENKIFARDSNHEEEGQLEKYYRTIIEENGIKEEHVEVYYLTLDGHEPSESSIATSKKYPKLKDKVCCISYPNEIKNWLTKCVKDVYNEPFQRETILQYLKLIKNMTNDVDIEERLEIKQLIGESQSNMKSAKLLIDNIKHLHWHTISEFWDNLANTLKAKGYEVLSQPQTSDFDTIVHGGERKKKQTILCIEIKTPNSLTISIEETYNDQLGFGVKHDCTLSKKKTNVFLKLCENNENYSYSDDWCIWTFPLPEKEELNSWYIDDDVTFQLINGEFQNQIINKIVMRIEQLLSDFESNSK
jgi:hypothetical protein